MTSKSFIIWLLFVSPSLLSSNFLFICFDLATSVCLNNANLVLSFRLCGSYVVLLTHCVAHFLTSSRSLFKWHLSQRLLLSTVPKITTMLSVFLSCPALFISITLITTYFFIKFLFHQTVSSIRARSSNCLPLNPQCLEEPPLKSRYSIDMC